MQDQARGLQESGCFKDFQLNHFPAQREQKLGELPSFCQRGPTPAASAPWGSCEWWHTTMPHLPVAELCCKGPASPGVPEDSG